MFERLTNLREMIRKLGPTIGDNLDRAVEVITEVVAVIKVIADLVKGPQPQILAGGGNRGRRDLSAPESLVADVEAAGEEKARAEAGDRAKEEQKEDAEFQHGLTAAEDVGRLQEELRSHRAQFAMLKRGAPTGHAAARPVAQIGPGWDQLCCDLVIKAIDSADEALGRKAARTQG